eukprot:g31074.t1
MDTAARLGLPQVVREPIRVKNILDLILTNLLLQMYLSMTISDKFNPANYRPISLLLFISKAMEGVINRAIKQQLLSNNLLSDAQFGFRQGHSAP